MVYHDRNDDSKRKAGWGRWIARGIGILILAGAVVAVAMYRNEIMTRVTKVFAARTRSRFRC